MFGSTVTEFEPGQVPFRLTVLSIESEGWTTTTAASSGALSTGLLV